jgi:AcrR family transcriptional regulator
LLASAHTLFSERGYDGATTRQIAELAEVDPALIARYFGGKNGLYIAAVALDGAVVGGAEHPAVGAAGASADGHDDGLAAQGNALPAITVAGLASWLFLRTRETGPGPSVQALVRSDTSAEIRAAASERIDELFTRPLTAAMDAAGVAQPRLRAEFVIFALVGLIVGRAQVGSELDTVSHEELVALVAAALTPVTVAQPTR